MNYAKINYPPHLRLVENRHPQNAFYQHDKMFSAVHRIENAIC